MEADQHGNTANLIFPTESSPGIIIHLHVRGELSGLQESFWQSRAGGQWVSLSMKWLPVTLPSTMRTALSCSRTYATSSTHSRAPFPRCWPPIKNLTSSWMLMTCHQEQAGGWLHAKGHTHITLPCCRMKHRLSRMHAIAFAGTTGSYTALVGPQSCAAFGSHEGQCCRCQGTCMVCGL